MIKQWPTNMPDEHSKWKREISAGGVVFKIGDGSAAAKASADRGIFILLIMPMGRNYVPPEGYWTFPKGKIDDGEEKSVAALREVKEETGYEILIIKLMRVVDNPDRPKEDRQNVSFVYLAKPTEKTGVADQESSEMKWFDLDKLPAVEEIAFDHYDNIKIYREGL